jgi:hypothetical protein
MFRLSLEQYEIVINALLPMQTGGWLPVLLAVATFKLLVTVLAWTGELSGSALTLRIVPHGEAGDISVYRNDELLFSVEVIERQIDRDRVVYVFTTKIVPIGLDDFVFFFTAREPTPEAREAARQYFAQGTRYKPYSY